MSDDPHMEPCRHCRFAGPHIVELQTAGVHHAKVSCGMCHRFLRWQSKPDDDKTKYRRPQQHRDLVKCYSRGMCEMCLRKEAELAKGQALEAQHVIEFKDGGSNERANIWILCTPCHRLVHWVRYYHGGEVDVLLEASLRSLE